MCRWCPAGLAVVSPGGFFIAVSDAQNPRRFGSDGGFVWDCERAFFFFVSFAGLAATYSPAS